MDVTLSSDPGTVRQRTFRSCKDRSVVNGFSVVGYFSNESRIPADVVSDRLGPSVGQENFVRPFDVVSVPGFLVAKLVSILVLHPVSVVVLGTFLEEEGLDKMVLK